MRLTLVIVGVLMIWTILWDAFETIILPRRVTRRVRLARGFYRSIWTPWALIAKRLPNRKRRDEYLALFGPLSLLLLLTMWAVGLIIGYALVQWSVHSPLNVSAKNVNLGTYL